MTARLSLVFSYDKDKQIFYYSLLCIYTICSKSVPSSQHRCTLPKIAVGGKTYGISSQDRLSASTAHAWGSGTGDTNCGSLLNLVTNRSTWGWCYREHMA